MTAHNDTSKIIYSYLDVQERHNPNGCPCSPPPGLVEVPPGAPCDIFYLSQDGYVHRYDIVLSGSEAITYGVDLLRDNAIKRARPDAVASLFEGSNSSGSVQRISRNQCPPGDIVSAFLQYTDNRAYDVYVSKDLQPAAGKYARNYFFSHIIGHIVVVNASAACVAPKVRSRELAQQLNDWMAWDVIDEGRFAVDDGDGNVGGCGSSTAGKQ